MKKHQKGFTLIELLVVIAIIGILAGIVLVSLGGARSSARDARRQADIRQVGQAMELDYNNDEAYPSFAADVDNSVPTGVETALAEELATFPVDPNGNSCGTEYCWISNDTDDQSYCIYAVLEADPGGGDTRYFLSDEEGSRVFDGSDADGADAGTWPDALEAECAP